MGGHVVIRRIVRTTYICRMRPNNSLEPLRLRGCAAPLRAGSVPGPRPRMVTRISIEVPVECGGVGPSVSARLIARPLEATCTLPGKS